MERNTDTIGRRAFIAKTGAATLFASATAGAAGRKSPEMKSSGKLRTVLVGTGIRGVSLWGKTIAENYADVVEFVGLCDINPSKESNQGNTNNYRHKIFANFVSKFLNGCFTPLSFLNQLNNLR